MKKKNVNNQIDGKIKPKRASLWQIFATFFKTGMFTFGGGYAMISILEEELVNSKKWITNADMLDMLVIAESTPGVIAVNTATSVGFKLRGVLGAIIATLGAVLPSFLIITALTFFINEFSDNVWYQAAFTGIQACVTILVINAFVKMSRQVERTWFSAVLLLAAFAVALFTDFDVIYIILIGGVLGIVYTLICDSISEKKKRNLPLADSEKLSENEQSDDEQTADEQASDEQPTDQGGEEQ